MSEHLQSGFLNINKPLRLTSHDVVAAVRRRFRAQTGSKKVGHTGTLDPLADGVLIICLGSATRLSEYMMQGRKIYQARITFGSTTSTYDAAGDVLTRSNTSQISRSVIEATLPQFIGDILQVPPMFSAIKLDGKKLYELARQGKTVARPARKVRIHAIDLMSWRNPVLELMIHCGAGTYIRSLAHDLGAALNTGAYLSGLTRVASGAFTTADSIELDVVLEHDEWTQHIICPFDALSEYTRVTLTEEEVERLCHGGFIARQPDLSNADVFAFDSQRRLIAVLQPRDELWKPHKVFLRQP